jgi:hypothetical protein
MGPPRPYSLAGQFEFLEFGDGGARNPIEKDERIRKLPLGEGLAERRFYPIVRLRKAMMSAVR